MAKSRTKSKARQIQQIAQQVRAKTVETAADLVAGYVRQWARHELQRLISPSQSPVISVIKNGYRVNNHRIYRANNDTWELYNAHNERKEVFVDKRSAVIYSILHQYQRYSSADEILAKDARLNKLQADFQHFDYSMRQAVRRKDYPRIDVLSSRYYSTKELLIDARNDLEKTLRLNKYLKVWDIGKPL